MHADLGHVRPSPTGWPRDCFRRAEASADEPLERESEIFGEQRVDHRIDGGIAVPDPEHDRKQQIVDAVVAEGPYQVHGEERKPTQDEQPHDNRQRFGRFGFHPEALHLSLNVPLAHPLAGTGRKKIPLSTLNRQILTALLLRSPPEDMRRRVFFSTIRRIVHRIQKFTALTSRRAVV